MIVDCKFDDQENECDYEKNFEYYEDSYYGTCLRFNSGRSMNQSLVPFKQVNNRGDLTGLKLYVNPDLNLRLWITNETVDYSQDNGELIPFGKIQHELKITKQTIIKQEKPYGDCLNGLDRIDSYDSEMFKRVFKVFYRRYHYTDCFNLCKQKKMGEKCQFQVAWFGLKYFEGMKEFKS